MLLEKRGKGMSSTFSYTLFLTFFSHKVLYILSLFHTLTLSSLFFFLLSLYYYFGFFIFFLSPSFLTSLFQLSCSDSLFLLKTPPDVSCTHSHTSCIYVYLSIYLPIYIYMYISFCTHLHHLPTDYLAFCL